MKPNKRWIRTALENDFALFVKKKTLWILYSSPFFDSCFTKNGAKVLIAILLLLPLVWYLMEWTNNHDLALAREVFLLEPYRHKVRTIERGNPLIL